MKNFGTFEGNIAEIEFVKSFNKNKSLFDYFLKNFKYSSIPWMIRVTTKQMSTLSEQKVNSRADAFLAIIDCDVIPLLKEHDFYIDEDILKKANIPFLKIPYSGISIKISSSNDFQIIKFTPKSFFKIFGSYELGAGASLFCQNDRDILLNQNVLEGWFTNKTKMIDFFKELEITTDFCNDKITCKKIKQFSCEQIRQKIDSNAEIKRKIFNGYGLYSEPYTASYFYKDNKITQLEYIPFSVTTGSGRHKGNYTIVLKPN